MLMMFDIMCTVVASMTDGSERSYMSCFAVLIQSTRS